MDAFWESLLRYSVGMGAGEYPADLERDVPLRDGGSIHLRPIRPDDVGRLQAFHGRLSRDSIFFRFFSPLPVKRIGLSAVPTAVSPPCE